MKPQDTINLRAVALPTNAECLIVWLWDDVIPDNLGFSLRRHDKTTGKKTTVSSRFIKFKGEGPQTKATTTDEHPIQGCKWSDGAIEIGHEYEWEVVTRIGKPGKFTDGVTATTNTVKIGFDYGPFIKACFNRGHLVSTQAIADMLPKDKDGKPEEGALKAAIEDPKSEIAKWLGSALPEFTMLPFEDAKKLALHVFSLYYQLNYKPLVEYLLANKDLWSLVLGNAGKDDEDNKDTRTRMHADKDDVTDYFLPSDGIPHNKSDVVADKAKKKGKKVMFKSVNPTNTGYYTQANHALYIDNEKVAQAALDYWFRTQADASADPKQSDAYRAANIKVMDPVVFPDGTSVQVIFSPCSMLRDKPKMPADGKTFPLLDMVPTMKVAKDAMMKAKQGVYAVAFFPGFPSVLDVISYLAYKKPWLPIRATVSTEQALPHGPRRPSGAGGTGGAKGIIDSGEGHPEAMTQTDSGLIVPAGAQSGSSLIVPATALPSQQGIAVFQPRKKFPTIIAAAALEDGWEDWAKELLKLQDAHAITHAKFIAIDPWGDDPVLIGAASDNMGLKAAIKNNEAFLVIRGNRALVQAYAVNAMGIYSHFLWRYLVRKGQSTFTGELSIDPNWQSKYLAKGVSRKEYEAILANAAK